jgi:uncharacterized protein
MLKLSNYTIIIPLTIPDNYLLYNTLSDTSILIQDEQNKIVGKKVWEQNDLSEDKETFQQLRGLGFLVGNEVNESGLAKKTLLDWRFNTELLEIMVLPTYWCNLGCSYCYQNEFDRSQTMSKSTCEQMLGWIENKLDEFRARRLNIKFFGGEALSKMSLLKIICNKLRDIASLKGIELNLDLITNGTLLNPHNVKQLNAWGVNSVKITIDGDETTHNLSRPFLNGKGSFQTIVNNITDQSDKLNIVLRCNYNQHNSDSILHLLDCLAERGLNNQLEYIEFQPVLHRSDFVGSDNNQHCNQSVFTNQQIKQFLCLTTEALNRGFQVNTELSGGRCPAFFKSSFLIAPTGNIFKCPAFLGNGQYTLGNVQVGKLNYISDTFLMDESWNDCLDCSFLPICCGGCRYAALRRFGSFLGNKVCEKEYFEKIGISLLKLTYDQQVAHELAQPVEHN